MTPAERSQAVALLCQAEAIWEQATALLHLAEAQIRAANALLATVPPSVESPGAEDARTKIFGERPEPTRHYGSVNRIRPQPDGEATGT